MKGGVKHFARRKMRGGDVMLQNTWLHGCSGARNLVFFRVKAGDERYLVCAAIAGTIFFVPALLLWRIVASRWVDSCMRSCMVIWSLGLQIAVEWLHESCHRSVAMCIERCGFAT